AWVGFGVLGQSSNASGTPSPSASGSGAPPQLQPAWQSPGHATSSVPSHGSLPSRRPLPQVCGSHASPSPSPSASSCPGSGTPGQSSVASGTPSPSMSVGSEQRQSARQRPGQAAASLP